MMHGQWPYKDCDDYDWKDRDGAGSDFKDRMMFSNPSMSIMKG